jgi:hypothetical protein
MQHVDLLCLKIALVDLPAQARYCECNRELKSEGQNNQRFQLTPFQGGAVKLLSLFSVSLIGILKKKKKNKLSSESWGLRGGVVRQWGNSGVSVFLIG